MKQYYLIRCPECNLALKKVESIDEIPREPIACYGCDTEINTIEDECIETIFLPSIQPSSCPDGKDIEVKWDNETTSKEVICLLDNKDCGCHGYRPECNKKCRYCGSIRELDQIDNEYYVCKTCSYKMKNTFLYPSKFKGVR